MQKHYNLKKWMFLLLVMLVVWMGVSIRSEAASLNQTKATIYVGSSHCLGKRQKVGKVPKSQLPLYQKKVLSLLKKQEKQSLPVQVKETKNINV